MPVTELAEWLRRAGVVTLRVPMSRGTAGLVHPEALALMERQPIPINTAPDGLVVLDDAIAALDDGMLSGGAPDVADLKPPAVANPLRGLPRAIFTPHMVFRPVAATERLQRRAAAEVGRAPRGEPPQCPVDSVPAIAS